MLSVTQLELFFLLLLPACMFKFQLDKWIRSCANTRGVFGMTVKRFGFGRWQEAGRRVYAAGFVQRSLPPAEEGRQHGQVRRSTPFLWGYIGYLVWVFVCLRFDFVAKRLSWIKMRVKSPRPWLSTFHRPGKERCWWCSRAVRIVVRAQVSNTRSVSGWGFTGLWSNVGRIGPGSL